MVPSYLREVGMDLDAGVPCLPGCALLSLSLAAAAACCAFGCSIERSSRSIHCSLLTPYLRSSKTSGCWNLQVDSRPHLPCLRKKKHGSSDCFISEGPFINLLSFQYG